MTQGEALCVIWGATPQNWTIPKGCLRLRARTVGLRAPRSCRLRLLGLRVLLLLTILGFIIRTPRRAQEKHAKYIGSPADLRPHQSRNPNRTSGHLKVEILNGPLDTSKFKL